MLFDVRVIAFDPHSTEDPVEALVRVFKVERAIARELVHRLPRVIKRAVPIETAQRFCDVLDRLGAKTEIVATRAPEGVARPAALPEAPAAGLPHAPVQARPPLASARGQGLPAPSPSMLLGHGPANANAAPGIKVLNRDPRAAVTDALLGSGDSSIFLLPEPITSDGFALLQREAQARAQAKAPAPARRRSAREPALDDVRARHGLPEPREPEPLEADIEGFVEHAFKELAPGATRPSRRPTLVQESQEVRITRPSVQHPTPLPVAPPPRASALDASLGPASAPAALRTADPLGARADFRPARPAPDLPRHGAPVALREELPTREFSAAQHDLIGESARESAPALREVAPVLREPPPILREAAPVLREPPPALHGALPGAPSSAASLVMPALAIPGPAVDLRDPELGPGKAVAVKAQVMTACMLSALALITFGLVPLVLVYLWAQDVLRRWALVRAMQGSALPVGQAQLPELYACVKQFAVRLDLKRTPRAFVGRGLGADVVAVPYRGELYLLFDGEALAAKIARGSTHVVTFLVAHELSRYALGQRTRLHAGLARLWGTVQRADALSADAVAARLLMDKHLAVRALLELLVGSGMATLLDRAELERQTASHVREGAAYAPALDRGTTGALLARIHQLQVSAGERAS